MSAAEEDREPTRGWWRGRRRLAAAGALGLAALAVIVAVASGAGDDEQGDDSASRSTATTRIERKDLVESEEVDGTLGYADSRTVINRMSGTVTWLPREGSVVKPGERLYAVEGKSVYLLDGRYPAYRTLAAGVEGQDVAQLEHNLRALGFDDDKDMDVDGEWDSATTAAVQRWQRSEGLDDDGSIEVGRVVFQPGARRISERLVDSGGSADAGGGSGSGGDGANIGASADGAGARTIFASLPIAAASQEVEPTPTPTPSPTATPTPTPTPSPTTTPTPTPTPQRTPSPAPQATPTPTPTAPSTGGGGAPSGGMSGGGGGSFGGGAPSTGSTSAVQDGAASGGDEQSVASEILTTTSRRRVVTVDLPTTRVRLAKRGAEVEVEMPDGSDVDGTITRVGRVATTEEQSDGSESDPTIQLTIRLAKTKGFVIDLAPVDVQLEQRRAEDVLTVPVTALLAQTGGNFAVEVVERDGRRRVVPVEPGMYTDGDVEIEGEGLEEGMTVTDARV